jgi:hypothetical protein
MIILLRPAAFGFGVEKMSSNQKFTNLFRSCLVKTNSRSGTIDCGIRIFGLKVPTTDRRPGLLQTVQLLQTLRQIPKSVLGLNRRLLLGWHLQALP